MREWLGTGEAIVEAAIVHLGRDRPVRDSLCNPCTLPDTARSERKHMASSVHPRGIQKNWDGPTLESVFSFRTYYLYSRSPLISRA